ncbi:MAG: hypothetical protein Q9163_000043 [Psora crenata]
MLPAKAHHLTPDKEDRIYKDTQSIMSELQRSFAKAKLAGLPLEPPFPSSLSDLPDGTDEQADEFRPLLPEQSPDDDSSSASSASSASSTGTIRPSPSKHLFARPRGILYPEYAHASSAPNGKRILDPLPWNDYFSQELYLESKNCDKHETVLHHAYITLPTGKGPLLVTHHGAGSSGISFALFASEIRKALPTCGILSLDARGHGETIVTASKDSTEHRDHPENGIVDGNVALDLNTLSMDLYQVIRLTQKALAWADLPDLILVGHSLGGAVVTDLAERGMCGDALLGYAVLDVVEGSAMDALQSMQQYLSTRPQCFPSIQSAVDWHTRSRTIRSITSARISVPSLLRRTKGPVTSPSSASPPGSWTWRTDLSKTQSYWSNWFNGLSQKFLTAHGGKLLILAGTDRLDKELTIGQMQGKYQLQVIPEAGHFVHEDCAEKTAGYVAEFVKRNDRAGLVLPPKVGEMLKHKDWPLKDASNAEGM